MSQVTTTENVMDRMKGKIYAELDDAQGELRQGKCTREGLLNLLHWYMKDIQNNVNLILCFLDYEKVFDRFKHVPLMQWLSEIGLDGKDTYHQKLVLETNSLSANHYWVVRWNTARR